LREIHPFWKITHKLRYHSAHSVTRQGGRSPL
jgi:hypothetical protein